MLSHEDGEFESCQLCGHEQGLLDELVQPVATVLCQSIAVCRMFTFIGILRSSFRLFTKLEGRSWITIEASRVKAFREGRDAVQDNLRTGRPQVENNTVEFLASLLEADRQWTATEIGVSHKTVLHILHDILGYPKFAARWISQQWCNNGTAMQSHRPCWTGTKWKVTTFLDESSLWMKHVLAHTNQA